MQADPLVRVLPVDRLDPVSHLRLDAELLGDLPAEGLIESFAGVGLAAGEFPEPSQVLAQVNDILCEENDSGIFVTVFYGVIDHQAATLTYANGGHNPPYLTRAGRDVTALETTGGIALGVVSGLEYLQQTVDLCPEDTLFFYTDGITEAFDPAGNIYSDLRLKEVLYESRDLSVEALGRSVIGNVESFANGAPQSDDITCVVARYRAVTDKAQAA